MYVPWLFARAGLGYVDSAWIVSINFDSLDYLITRHFLAFSNSVQVESATLEILSPEGYTDGSGSAQIAITTGTFADPPTELTGWDFASYGTVELADRIPLSSFADPGWISTPLNADGIAALNSGAYAKMCVLIGYDLDNDEQPFSEQLEIGSASYRLNITEAGPSPQKGYAYFF